ncbi:MAG: N-acetylmuramoyl-L-alanine amidase [Elusimicrobiota bacterium]|nr:N-acetylmuramoyl-L-alanine amidase [Elusimicrobiota bacterium]
MKINKVKKVLVLICLLLNFVVISSSKTDIKFITAVQVIVNAQKIIELPVYKIDKIEEKYISIKDLAKIFSATLTYYHVGKYVSFNCRGERIYFFYNKNFFIHSKQRIQLSANVLNVHNRTFVPITILNNTTFTNILNATVEFRQNENLVMVNWIDTVVVSYYINNNDVIRIEIRYLQNTQYDYNLDDRKITLTFFNNKVSPKEYRIEHSIISKIKLYPENGNVRTEILLNNSFVQIKKEEFKDRIVLFIEEQSRLAEQRKVYKDKEVTNTAQNLSLKSNNKKPLVVIDPGHGGEDPGAVGKYGTKEKHINLAIAKIIKEELLSEDYKVLLTREDDISLALVERTKFANDNNADLFISIHCNASKKQTNTDHGVEVYFLSEKASDEDAVATEKLENEVVLKYERPTEELNKLQKILWSMIVTDYINESSRLCSYIGTEITARTKQQYRGVKQAGFYVLRGAQMPAVLVEVGFISNPDEELKLNSLDFQRLVANGIAAGIKKYYENNK